MANTTVLIERLVAAADEINALKRSLAISEAKLQAAGQDLSSMRGSCKAMGDELRKVRARNGTLTRAVAWVARELDLSLVGKPDWLLSTLQGVIEREQKVKQKGARA